MLVVFSPIFVAGSKTILFVVWIFFNIRREIWRLSLINRDSSKSLFDIFWIIAKGLDIIIRWGMVEYDPVLFSVETFVESLETNGYKDSDALRDLVPFIQLKKRVKQPSRSVQAWACNLTKSNTPAWVFFTFF